MTDSSDKGRHMNDSTMPPPSARVGADTSKKSKAPRNKVRLRKGFGLGDWNRLVLSSKDLAQRKGQSLRKIKWDEIQQHDKVYDGWTVLKGKVYFISPYLAYVSIFIDLVLVFAQRYPQTESHSYDC
jgi:hypothetical protein